MFKVKIEAPKRQMKSFWRTSLSFCFSVSIIDFGHVLCHGLHVNDFSNRINVFDSTYLVNDFTNQNVLYRKNDVGEMTFEYSHLEN